MSSRFAYSSLYDVAPLTPGDRELFDALGTTNFEEVLDHLRTASLVCRQLGHRSSEVRRRYNSIRGALLKAVNAHHVDWSEANTGADSFISARVPPPVGPAGPVRV